MPQRYTNYQIPDELAIYVKYAVDQRIHGYTSEMEFIKEAVRAHVRELQKAGVMPAFIKTVHDSCQSPKKPLTPSTPWPLSPTATRPAPITTR